MEAVTIAPTAGDTSMLAGGFIRLNGVLMIPAMIFAMGSGEEHATDKRYQRKDSLLPELMGI